MNAKELKEKFSQSQKLLKHLERKLEDLDLELCELSSEKEKVLKRKQILEIELSSLEHQMAILSDPSLDDKNMKSLFL